MRRFSIPFVFGLALAWVSISLSQQRSLAMPAMDRDSLEAIRAVLAAQQAAWNRGDIQSFLEGYWHSPDLTFSGNNGTTRGWDAVRERYKQSYPDRRAMGELNFSGLEFHFLGSDAALVLGRWHLKRHTGELGGVFTLVWQRFPDGWKIIHDHTSAVAPAKSSS